MIVKISRSKLLLNNQGMARHARRPKKPVIRCNHCGGLIRHDGELVACIMCSRDIDHVCDNCSHVRPSEVAAEKQKRA